MQLAEIKKKKKQIHIASHYRLWTPIREKILGVRESSERTARILRLHLYTLREYTGYWLCFAHKARTQASNVLSCYSTLQHLAELEVRSFRNLRVATRSSSFARVIFVFFHRKRKQNLRSFRRNRHCILGDNDACAQEIFLSFVRNCAFGNVFCSFSCEFSRVSTKTHTLRYTRPTKRRCQLKRMHRDLYLRWVIYSKVYVFLYIFTEH